MATNKKKGKEREREKKKELKCIKTDCEIM